MYNISKFPSASQRFILTLQVDLEGTIHVRSCEILGTEFRNRVSFNTKTEISEVLTPELAASLSDCVHRISKAKEVLSIPDFAHVAPGLAVAGIHLISSELSDKSLQVICRFKHFMGSLFAAVQPDIGISPQSVDYRDKLATEALTDITMPLLNIAKTLEMDVAEHQGNHLAQRELARLDELSAELAFYSEMLKRFIDNSLRPSSLPAPEDEMANMMLPETIEKLAIGS